MDRDRMREALQECLFWLGADEHGMTDCIGGSEWRSRCDNGSVSEDAKMLFRLFGVACAHGAEENIYFHGSAHPKDEADFTSDKTAFRLWVLNGVRDWMKEAL